jgi:hypothetical protein
VRKQREAVKKEKEDWTKRHKEEWVKCWKEVCKTFIELLASKSLKAVAAKVKGKDQSSTSCPLFHFSLSTDSHTRSVH